MDEKTEATIRALRSSGPSTRGGYVSAPEVTQTVRGPRYTGIGKRAKIVGRKPGMVEGRQVLRGFDEEKI